MPEHRFTYPRVVPVADPRLPRSDSAPPAARTARSQRELVAASLVRCPPRDARRPGKVKR